MTRLRIGGAILLVSMLLAAACGGDSGSDTTTAITVGTVADEGNEVGTTTTTEKAGNDDVDAGDLPAVLSSNDCLAAAAAIGSAFSGGFSSTGVFNADEVEAAFDRVREVAASEIKDDLAIMADALGEFFSILEDAGVDLSDPASMADPSVQEALERAGEKMEATEFEEAADNVNQWFDDECAGLGS